MVKRKKLVVPIIMVLLVSCNNQKQQNRTILNRVNFDNGLFSFVAQRPNEDPSMFVIDYYPDEKALLINKTAFTYVKQESMDVVEQKPIVPTKIFEFSNQYIFLAYSETPSEEVDKLNYLMDRKTGECFLFPTNSVPLFKYGNHDVSNNYYIGNFQTDKNGYIYYVANEYMDDKSTLYHPLNRIDLSNPNDIKITKISHDFDSVYDAYAINQDGDVAYRYKDNNDIKVAYIHHDGTYYQNDFLNNGKNLFTGFDNHIYVLLPSEGNVNIEYFDYNDKTLKKVASYQGDNCDFEEIFYIEDFLLDADKKTDIVAGLYEDGFQTLYIDDMSGELACSTFSTKNPQVEGFYSLVKEDRRPFFSFNHKSVILASVNNTLGWPTLFNITPHPESRFQNARFLDDDLFAIEDFFAAASIRVENPDFVSGLSIYFVDTSDENKNTFDICLDGQMFNDEFIRDNNWSVVSL